MVNQVCELFDTTSEYFWNARGVSGVNFTVKERDRRAMSVLGGKSPTATKILFLRLSRGADLCHALRVLIVFCISAGRMRAGDDGAFGEQHLGSDRAHQRSHVGALGRCSDRRDSCGEFARHGTELGPEIARDRFGCRRGCR